MKIVIVEDDEYKQRQIVALMSEEFSNHEISTARSYTSGLREIRSVHPDLVLLDMSLPNFDGEFSSTDGGKFRSYGGRDILHQIVRRGLPSKVIVVTAYDTFSSETNATSLDALGEELKGEFSGNFIDIVFYSASNDEWKLALRRWMEILS
jgi:DNA-binding NarL/FixJ family response regulator